jgi:hypothetical protein
MWLLDLWKTFVDHWIEVATVLRNRLQFVLSDNKLFVTSLFYESWGTSMVHADGPKLNEFDTDRMSLFNP